MQVGARSRNRSVTSPGKKAGIRKPRGIAAAMEPPTPITMATMAMKSDNRPVTRARGSPGNRCSTGALTGVGVPGRKEKYAMQNAVAP